MEPSEFKSERAGKLKSIPNTIFHYFEPNELPFEVKYTPEIVKLISEASLSLGNLSEAGRKLRNPHLLIMPYLKKEAVLSSKIEGTKTTLSDVFMHEAEKKKRTKDDDLQEVMNYVKAIQDGLSRINTEKLSVQMIKDLHKILLTGVRGEDKDPGKFKTEINWIGTSYDIMEAKFIPCSPESVERLMINLIEYLNNHNETNLIKIGISHYQFETIHPFRDGNGRLGRLLIILYLCQEKIISQPLFYISAFFVKFREDYDARLKRVSTAGDVEGWLKFFLTGVKKQADDAVLRVEQMEELREKYRQKLLDISQSTTVHHILDYLFENPFLTIPEVKERLKCHYSKAKYNVEILLSAEIISEVERQKGARLFIANEILEILEL